MTCHEPEMDQWRRDKKNDTRTSLKWARERLGQDQRCAGLGCDLPQIRKSRGFPSFLWALVSSPPYGENTWITPTLLTKRRKISSVLKFFSTPKKQSGDWRKTNPSIQSNLLFIISETKKCFFYLKLTKFPPSDGGVLTFYYTSHVMNRFIPHVHRACHVPSTGSKTVRIWLKIA